MRRLTLISSILGLLAFPAVAGAAVTIGESTSSAGNSGINCGLPDGCTFATIQHQSRPIGAPFDGVIVRWRVWGIGGTVAFTPRVLHPFPGGTFVGAGTGAPETIVPGAERTIPTRLPIRQGDIFGIDVANGGGVSGANPVPGAIYAEWGIPAPLADGGTPRAPNTTLNQSLFMNADVEADCDRDGLGDETQDSDLSACAKRASTKVKGKVKVKPAGGGRFAVLTGIDASCPPAAGGTCTGVATVKRAGGTQRLASLSQTPKKLGRKKLSLAVGKTLPVKVKLTRKASEGLREAGEIRAKIDVRLVSPAEGPAATRSRTANLKAP